MVENDKNEAPLSYHVNIVTALNKVSICKGVKCQIDFFNIILKGYKLIIYINVDIRKRSVDFSQTIDLPIFLDFLNDVVLTSGGLSNRAGFIFTEM